MRSSWLSVQWPLHPHSYPCRCGSAEKRTQVRQGESRKMLQTTISAAKTTTKKNRTDLAQVQLPYRCCMFRGPKRLKVNSVKVAASEAQVLQGLGHGLEDLTQAAHQVVEAEIQANQKREGCQEVAQGLAVLRLAACAPVLMQRNENIHLGVCACCCVFLVGG